MDEKRKERLIKKYERTVEEPAKKGPGHGPRGGRLLAVELPPHSPPQHLDQ